MICAPSSSNSSGCRVLTEPCVPTGMKIGVSTTPCGNSNLPSRARESGAVFNKVNGTGGSKSKRTTMARLVLRLTRIPQLTAATRRHHLIGLKFQPLGQHRRMQSAVRRLLLPPSSQEIHCSSEALYYLCGNFHGRRRSRALHRVSAAPAALPFMRRAPSLRRSLKRSRALAKASFTNALLPMIAPSLK